MTIPSRRHLIALPLAAVLVAVAGCASTPPQATVQVFTSQPQLQPGATYRHERLPSQAGQPGQEQLEAAADAVLARAGLRRDDTGGRLALQVTASQDRTAGDGPGWGWGPSVGIGIGGGSRGGGVGVGLGFPIGGVGGGQASQRVDVQLRDVPTGQVVFQSQASGSAGAGAPALVAAALRDFPNAPPGMRQLPLGDAATPGAATPAVVR